MFLNKNKKLDNSREHLPVFLDESKDKYLRQGITSLESNNWKNMKTSNDFELLTWLKYFKK